MTNPENDEPGDEIRIGDFFAPLLQYRHLIWYATITATALAVLAGGIYYFWQPVRWSTSLGFQPVFEGAAVGQYPNKLPFSSTDVVDSTVIDQVHAKNHVQDPCAPGDFRSGFVVEESSSEMLFLDLDYQARLSDTRLSTVDRERLQSEYRARRHAMPVQYRLTWLRSDACRNVPAAVATKALGEVLQTWADDADLKRGVLKLRIAVLTPTVFDTGSVNDQSPLIRTDLIHSALTRVIASVREVQKLPGSELIRVGADGTTFAQVRARLEDLVQVHLDPLGAQVGRGLGSDVVHWVEQSLASAIDQQKAAESRANAYQTALREYSGASTAPSPAGVQRSQSPSDVQALTPQIDRTFIDRIVELTAANTTFRQALTTSMVDAKVAAVETALRVDHYKRLLANVKSSSAASLGVAEVDRRLTAIVADAKEQVTQFNALYDEFSRVSLRSGPSMYRIDRPTQVEILKSFTMRSLLILILAVLFGAPFVLAIGCLAHHALRQIAKRPLRA